MPIELHLPMPMNIEPRSVTGNTKTVLDRYDYCRPARRLHHTCLFGIIALKALQNLIHQQDLLVREAK